MIVDGLASRMCVSGSSAGLESIRFAAKNAKLDSGKLAINYGSMTIAAPLIFYFTIFAAYVSPHVIDLIAASKKTMKTSLSASYALRFYLYPFVVGVIVTVIAVKLRPYGLLANIAFAIIAAYLAIKIGRCLLGRKHL